MRNYITSLRGLAMVAMLTTMGVATASADNWWSHPKRAPLVPVADDGLYNTSGRFTGYLSGNIEVNGQTFRVTNQTQIYELGIGSEDVGGMVTDRFIFMMVSRVDGGNTVESIIIRPLSDSTDPDLPVTITVGPATEPM